MSKPPRQRPRAWPADAKNWSAEEVGRFLEAQRSHPESAAHTRLWKILNDAAVDAEIAQSEVLQRFVFMMRDMVADFAPDWSLRDILIPLENAIRSEAAEPRMTRLADINKAKADAKTWAEDYAKSQWDADVDKSVRISEMAGRVWKAIVETSHCDARPDNVAQITEWIGSVAPKYASKPGRPRRPK